VSEVNEAAASKRPPSAEPYTPTPRPPSHTINASGVSWNKGVLDPTGAQMVLTLKLISTAMCLQDYHEKKEEVGTSQWTGQCGRAERRQSSRWLTLLCPTPPSHQHSPSPHHHPQEMTPYQRVHHLKSLPSLLEFFGYVFCFGNLLAGPIIEFKDYQNFIRNEGPWDPRAARKVPVLGAYLQVGRWWRLGAVWGGLVRGWWAVGERESKPLFRVAPRCAARSLGDLLCSTQTSRTAPLNRLSTPPLPHPPGPARHAHRVPGVRLLPLDGEGLVVPPLHGPVVPGAAAVHQALRHAGGAGGGGPGPVLVCS
jgi:hypothetical protein